MRSFCFHSPSIVKGLTRLEVESIRWHIDCCYMLFVFLYSTLCSYSIYVVFYESVRSRVLIFPPDSLLDTSHGLVPSCNLSFQSGSLLGPVSNVVALEDVLFVSGVLFVVLSLAYLIASSILFLFGSHPLENKDLQQRIQFTFLFIFFLLWLIRFRFCLSWLSKI